jgi:SAM-dependent methyltransferase
VKSYDRAYFERWYRNPTHRVSTRESVTRKVRLAVGVAEYLLGRPIRTVIDVGCGEAPWQPVLARLRPTARYIGVDSSEYAIERFGETRNIRRGSVGELAQLRLPRNVDLIVCADVLQYVTDREVEHGLVAMRRLLGGVAYIEAFATEDFMEGDREDWRNRSAAAYRRMFHRAGLTRCGPHCYVDLERFDTLNVFEHERP